MEPVRTCVGCRAKAGQSLLLRLAWDGQAVIMSRTAYGRGAWVHPTPECLQAAGRKGVLSRAFRTTVPADDGLERLLEGQAD